MRFFVVLLFVFLVPLITSAADATDVAARRAQLEQDLAKLEQEIASQQQILSGKQQERQSLERDVAILNAQIEKAKLSIRARDLSIQKLSEDISSKANTIVALDEKVVRERQSLAEILRKTNALDEQTLVEFIFATQSVSTFFEDLDSFAAIKGALSESFVEIADTKVVTAEAKTTLEEKRTDQQQLRQLQVLERNKIQEQESQKQSIIKITKGVESAYQTLIKGTQKNAAQIRAELFTLRDSAAIPFGQALEYANFASSKTGVRAAVILGVLKQETKLGENLGTGTYINDMHPTRDVPVFLKITETLGLDPARMPVSRQPGYGWGGAMGPAQFIPSTWACYAGYINVNTRKCANNSTTYAGPFEYDVSKDIVRRLIGKDGPSNPWDNKDAFTASGLLMKENGAGAQTYAAERLAALRYFAGWGNANKPAYAFYGDSVMQWAGEFQILIDQLG